MQYKLKQTKVKITTRDIGDFITAVQALQNQIFIQMF